MPRARDARRRHGSIPLVRLHCVDGVEAHRATIHDQCVAGMDVRDAVGENKRKSTDDEHDAFEYGPAAEPVYLTRANRGNRRAAAVWVHNWRRHTR